MKDKFDQVGPPKVSRHALIAVTGGIVSMLLIFMSPVPAILLGTCIVVAEALAIPGLLRDRGHRRGTWFGVLIFLLTPIMAVMHAVWRMDAAPIPNDYSVSDLRATAPGNLSSYALLCSLGDSDIDAEGSLAIGLSEGDQEEIDRISAYRRCETYDEIIHAIDEDTDDIMRLWERSRKGRNILEQLALYTEIADLSELDMNASPPYLKNLKNMSVLTWAYGSTQIRLGNEDTTIPALARLQSIAKGMHPQCRSMPGSVGRSTCTPGPIVIGTSSTRSGGEFSVPARMV